tara:strand:- start:164 stop:280 length:117 start_codon:yes stop_codon:yes gene_type:complete
MKTLEKIAEIVLSIIVLGAWFVGIFLLFALAIIGLKGD